MPYLVSVKGNRIPLRRGHSYSVGRGRMSDIVLRDRACSRVHAKLSVHRSSNDLVLEDLHSRNGTYLDGDLVLKRTLVPDGSRVRLGTSIFLVRLDDPAEETCFAETGTLSFDEAEADGDIEAGELASVGLVELLTRLLIDRRDVTLRVALPTEEARVELRAGMVRAAEIGALEGFNALVRVGRQRTGIFWLTDCSDPCEARVQERPDRLLSQLSRCLDPVSAR